MSSSTDNKLYKNGYSGPGLSRTVLTMAFSSLLLFGCTSDTSDLQRFVDDTMRSQKPNVEPLPEFKAFPVYKYEAGDLRDPFAESAYKEQLETADIPIAPGGLRPPVDKQKEPLEEYPLDTLRMVGSIEQTGTMWALIKDGEGSIHRVKTGNYIGRNYGKIISITEHQVDLREIVPSGRRGLYIERDASIALSE
ncbi:MAG: pilus assembly protein PilP [Gammaproteobacteria bacterium]|nr:MAG: pilus assembly protein PilP [Gammaproteobacteria bacterium]